jgi:hypothetical protein
MTKLPKFCEVIHGVLPRAVCEGLIDQFEESKNQERLDNNGTPTFTQLVINQHMPDLVQPLVRYVIGAVDAYRQCNKLQTKYLPNVKALEELRIKRYNGDTEDRFDAHVDVTDAETMKRYLALLFYLNDDFTGGETSFIGYDAVKPKRGSVLVFPPTWQYPHAGLPVQAGTKYIMSTYLHFV